MKEGRIQKVNYNDFFQFCNLRCRCSSDRSTRLSRCVYCLTKPRVYLNLNATSCTIIFWVSNPIYFLAFTTKLFNINNISFSFLFVRCYIYCIVQQTHLYNITILNTIRQKNKYKIVKSRVYLLLKLKPLIILLI